jgi:hypothetical protein
MPTTPGEDGTMDILLVKDAAATLVMATLAKDISPTWLNDPTTNPANTT